MTDFSLYLYYIGINKDWGFLPKIPPINLPPNIYLLTVWQHWLGIARIILPQFCLTHVKKFSSPRIHAHTNKQNTLHSFLVNYWWYYHCFNVSRKESKIKEYIRNLFVFHLPLVGFIMHLLILNPIPYSMGSTSRFCWDSRPKCFPVVQRCDTIKSLLLVDHTYKLVT